MIGTSALGAFSTSYRASGVLLHVASLPSPYGIGDLGPSAFAFIDLLHEAGQSWWQVLPLGPTGYGNSPYQPLSTFAGNELLFSPEGLIEDGLLQRDACTGNRSQIPRSITPLSSRSSGICFRWPGRSSVQ